MPSSEREPDVRCARGEIRCAWREYKDVEGLKVYVEGGGSLGEESKGERSRRAGIVS